MTTNHSSEITGLLLRWNNGDDAAREQLIPLVYDELRGIAARLFRRERPGHLLQTTALVNEAYLRLADARALSSRNRAQFFGLAARLMRQILVDHARARDAVKRGDGTVLIPLDEAPEAAVGGNIDVLMLDDLLIRLAELSPRQHQVVEMRFFAGLTVPEISEALAVSERTVQGDWTAARAWLLAQWRG